MGMFDTFIFHPDDAPKCHAGHPILSTQTKDLACKLTNFLVCKGKIYSLASEQADSGYRYNPKVQAREGGTIVLTEETRGTPYPLQRGKIRVYTSCHQCDPILAVSQWGYDDIDEKHVWVELSLEVDGFDVVGWELVNGDRQAQIEAFQKQGARVFADDHPIAVAHNYKKEMQDERQ